MTEQCPLYKKCGGCQLQNLSYEEQLLFKERLVTKHLGRFAHVSKIIGMEQPYHYRNKVQAAFGSDRRGNVISGIYQSSSHRIVPVDTCMTEDQVADKVIVWIRSAMKSFKIEPYDEDRGRGLLRHVLVKRGFQSGEVMVVLVTAHAAFPSKSNFTKALTDAFPEITTVVQSINPGKTSLVLGKEENVWFGRGYIEDTLCEMIFRISPRSFYQINPIQTEKLYGKAVEFAALTGKETVIDAYCGIGTIGLIAARRAGFVIGAELNSDAVRDAVWNAARNGVENIRFLARDAGEFMLETAKSGQSAEVVFMDPPRAGSDVRFLRSLISLAPERIVYVSCNPETQERDLMFLCKKDYRVRAIQPVDMFPHTKHVETVVLLTHAAGGK